MEKYAKAPKSTTFSTANYSDCNTPVWAEIARWVLKSLFILIPAFGGRLGLTSAEMTTLTGLALSGSEALKLFSKK